MTVKFHRVSGALVSLVLGASIILVTAGPSAAAPSDGYGTWQVTSSPTGYTGTVSAPAGFPAVAFRSDSRVVGSTPVQSGATVWVPAGTSFGDAYGSSEGKQYINLRPKADNASTTSASTTTYTFATPTPVGTWGINFGDIDAESLTISAIDATGTPVSAANLGVQPAYNYCNASPRSSSCSGQSAPYIVPTVTNTPSTIVVQDTECPTTSARCDTAGAAVWFSPLVPLSSLTVTSAWKQGFPSYQTWFATTSRTITGTVNADCVTGTEFDVQLLNGDREVVASTTTASGSYAFASVAARNDYNVRVDPASLASNLIAAPLDVDVSTADTTADLAVTSTFSATGTITDTTTPIADVEVELARTDDTAVVGRTLTSLSGAYEFTGLTSGDYVARPNAPTGSTVTPTEHAFSIECAGISIPPFALLAEDSASDPVDPPTDPSPGAEPLADELPATGSDLGLALVSAPILISVGFVAIGAVSFRRRMRSASSS
jgi:hypothetical protein